MKQLIINADDLGWPDTFQTIRGLHEAGLVTSTTALVNQPEWPQAASWLKRTPGIGAGVHLVMNNGRPVLPPAQVPSLVDRNGEFRDGTALLLRYGRLSVRQLEAEWRAQIEKFIADCGRRPDHLDLHCFYPYVFLPWFRVSLKLAREYGCAVRRPFDDAFEGKVPFFAVMTGFPAWFVRWNGRRYIRLVSECGVGFSDYWEATFSMAGNEHRSAGHLLELLQALPDGSTEMVCHPGSAPDWRRLDAEALLDPRVLERIQALKIRLITYADLKP